MTASLAPGRVARLLPLALALVLVAEAITGVVRHRSIPELAESARSGDVRERAAALYRLARRGDGSAASVELREEAAAADPRLAVLVFGVLDDGGGERLQRPALIANEPSPESRRYLELMFERARTHDEYRELLSRR